MKLTAAVGKGIYRNLETVQDGAVHICERRVFIIAEIISFLAFPARGKQSSASQEWGECPSRSPRAGQQKMQEPEAGKLQRPNKAALNENLTSLPVLNDNFPAG